MPRKNTKKQKSERETNKGWAEGAREDFLNTYVDDFAEAMGKGATAEEEVLRKVIRRYFFFFDLDDNVEPARPLNVFDEAWIPPLEDGTVEQLRAKRDLREKKKKAIRAWLTYRALKITSIRSTVRRRMLSDAYLALLNKVGKLGLRPAKARSAFQEWQKRNKKDATRIVSELWETEVAAGREKIPARGGICPKFRQKTVQAHFQSLSAAEQKLWAEKAKADAEEKRRQWNEIFNGPPSEAPEDRADCVKKLPVFLQPVAEGIKGLTGLMTIVHVVGPMGVLNGEIGVVSVCSGKNLDPVPVSVAGWDAKAYEDWRTHLVKFAQTAYTQSTKDSFKLTSNPTLPADFKPMLFEDDTLDEVVGSMNAEVAARDTGNLGRSDDESDSEDDEDDEPRKRPAASTAASARKRQKTASEGKGNTADIDDRTAVAHPSDPLLVKVDGRWISKYEQEREANMRKNKAILDALQVDTAGLWKAVAKEKPPAPQSRTKGTEVEGGRRHSSRLTTSAIDVSGSSKTVGQIMEEEATDKGAPMDIDDTSAPMDVDQNITSSSEIVDTVRTLARMDVDGPGSASILPKSSASEAVAHSSSLMDETTAQTTSTGSGTTATGVLLVESEIEGTREGSPLVGTEVDEESQELLLEAPDWFKLPFQVFSAVNWGDSWKDLLECFIKLEGSVEYKASDGTLPSVGRPVILSDWVVGGRLKPKKNGPPSRKMLALKAKDLPAFKATFCGWWDSVQPAWRKEKDGKWLQTRHGRDFGALDAWGQNGWLSIVACLYWWREVAMGENELKVWEKYVSDAIWLMEGLRVRGHKSM